jgi:hypothetical protein
MKYLTDNSESFRWWRYTDIHDPHKGRPYAQRRMMIKKNISACSWVNLSWVNRVMNLITSVSSPIKTRTKEYLTGCWLERDSSYSVNRIVG